MPDRGNVQFPNHSTVNGRTWTGTQGNLHCGSLGYSWKMAVQVTVATTTVFHAAPPPVATRAEPSDQHGWPQ